MTLTQHSFMRRITCLLACSLLLSGCVHITMDPIRIDHNVNVNIRLQKAVDDFFSDVDAKPATPSK